VLNLLLNRQLLVVPGLQIAPHRLEFFLPDVADVNEAHLWVKDDLALIAVQAEHAREWGLDRVIE